MTSELRNKIKKIFKRDSTFNTPHFMIKDIDLNTKLIDLDDEYPITKNEIYAEVRSMSLKSEDLIAARMIETGEDFDEARNFVKHTFILPILVKIRCFGWREPDVHELDEDQKKRLAHATRSLEFCERRTERIEKIMLPQEIRLK